MSLESIESRYRSVCHLEVNETDEFIMVSTIQVQAMYRRRGIGTSIMERIIEYADEEQKLVVLTPSMGLGATSVGRLVRFYRRFGFVLNQGRHRKPGIGSGMYRDPVQGRRLT